MKLSQETSLQLYDIHGTWICHIMLTIIIVNTPKLSDKPSTAVCAASLFGHDEYVSAG